MRNKLIKYLVWSFWHCKNCRAGQLV